HRVCQACALTYAMNWKSTFYFLILILMWGWIDDLVVSTANADPSDDSATSENDQYLPAASVKMPNRLSTDITPPGHQHALGAVEATLLLPTFGRHSSPEHDSANSMDLLCATVSLQC